MRELTIAGFESVTAKQVGQIFRKVFYENPKRINMKIQSQCHKDATAKRQESQKKNEVFYQN